MQQETAGVVPADYYASVFIHETALRKVPDIYAPIEDTAHHGDILHIIAEREDGLCKTDNGLWVLGASLKQQ